jgi:hypothetical protein
LNHGIAGAVLMKLTILKRIRIENKRVHIIDSSSTDMAFLDYFLNYINGYSKPKKVRRWVHKLAYRLRKKKYEVIDNLIERGILNKEKKHWLGFIPYTIFPTIDSTQEEELRNHLLAIIHGQQKVNPKSLMLLSLLEATKLTRTLFQQRKSYRYARKRIKALTKDFESNSMIHATIKEVCSAVITASTSAAVGTYSSFSD